MKVEREACIGLCSSWCRGVKLGLLLKMVGASKRQPQEQHQVCAYERSLWLLLEGEADVRAVRRQASWARIGSFGEEGEGGVRANSSFSGLCIWNRKLGAEHEFSFE